MSQHCDYCTIQIRYSVQHINSIRVGWFALELFPVQFHFNVGVPAAFNEISAKKVRYICNQPWQTKTKPSSMFECVKHSDVEFAVWCCASAISGQQSALTFSLFRVFPNALPSVCCERTFGMHIAPALCRRLWCICIRASVRADVWKNKL